MARKAGRFPAFFAGTLEKYHYLFPSKISLYVKVDTIHEILLSNPDALTKSCANPALVRRSTGNENVACTCAGGDNRNEFPLNFGF